MASKRTGRKFLSDAVVNARAVKAGPKPSRVTIISGGMKYKYGQDPVPVCPVGSVRGAVRRAMAQPLPK